MPPVGMNLAGYTEVNAYNMAIPVDASAGENLRVSIPSDSACSTWLGIINAGDVCHAVIQTILSDIHI